MDGFFARCGVRTLDDFLALAGSTNIEFRDAIDGGACDGQTACRIAEHTSGTVYAYEPLPNNIERFNANPRVELRALALSDRRGSEEFAIPALPSSDRHGSNPFGYLSGSMLGKAKIAYGRLTRGDSVERMAVSTVRGDDDLPIDAHVDFIKLDLQGGECRALDGLHRTAQDSSVMWIEFTGSQWGLLRRLFQFNLMIFETEYVFAGPQPSSGLLDDFAVTRTGLIGPDQTGWRAVRRHPWRNFALEFQYLKRFHGLVQTDLLCLDQSIAVKLAHAL